MNEIYELKLIRKKDGYEKISRSFDPDQWVIRSDQLLTDAARGWETRRAIFEDLLCEIAAYHGLNEVVTNFYQFRGEKK